MPKAQRRQIPARDVEVPLDKLFSGGKSIECVSGEVTVGK